MAELEVGKKAPPFTLPNAAGDKRKLNDFKGSWLVLYFYPRDNTPGCTLEAKDFSKLLKQFNDLDAQVVGVSKDNCASHQKFIEKQKLKIELLSDDDTKMQQKYGVWQLKKFMGRESMGTVRTTFLIDPDGKIAHIWPKVKTAEHAANVLKKLKEFV